MTMRKICFSLILTLLPMVASADKSGKCGANVNYVYESANKTLTISGTGDMYDFDIYGTDSELPPFPSDAQTIVIESGVTSIGYFAFAAGMTQLTSVKIPSTISKISKYSFKGCINLKNISSDIMNPSSVTMGYGVFDDIPTTAKLTVPLGTISKYNSANNWNRFTNVVDPETATGKCGDNVCYTYKFADKSLTISGTGDMYAFDINGTPSELPPFPGSAQSIVIGSGVTSIGLFAFSGMTDLTALTIPNSLNKISKYSLNGCSKVRYIFSEVINPSSVTLGFDVFGDIPSTATLVVPIGCKDKYKSADGWKKFTNVVEMSGKCGHSVYYVYDEKTHTLTIAGEGPMDEAIDDPTYYPWNSYRSKIQHLVIESGVTAIGDYAFDNCTNLISATIPDGVTYIGLYAFNWCTNLATVLSGIKSPFDVDDRFNNISSTATLIVPLGTKAAYQAKEGWEDFSNIEETVIRSGIKYRRVEIGKKKMVAVAKTPEHSGNITIPATIYIDGETYTVTSIDDGAFDVGHPDYTMTSISLPSTLTSIGQEAFIDQQGLTAVYIKDLAAWCQINFTGNDANPLKYAHHLFLNNQEITDLVIPNSVTSIGRYAFQGGSSITSVTIPNNVTSIGNNAFYGCSGLATVTSNNNEPFAIGELVFKGIPSTTQLIVPVGTKARYESAGWKLNFKDLVDSSPFGDCVLDNIDWREQPNYYTDVWYTEGTSVYVAGAGLVIENPSAKANYWDVQVPILKISELDEGGQYRVKFTLISPVSGELRLEIVSQDGTNTTMSAVVNVTEGTQEYAVDFLDFPSDCKNAMLFFQCGKLPGHHIVQVVQVINLNPSLIKKKTVVSSAGLLSNYISEEEMTQLTKLTVRGPINGTDIAFLRRMAGAHVHYLDDAVFTDKEKDYQLGKLTYLDISGATIVSGGDYYFRNWHAVDINEYFDPVKAATLDNMITKYMFYGCKLKKLLLPENVTAINEYAVSSCSNLTNITVPDGVTEIGLNAFEGSTNLTDIYLPNSLTSIGQKAFEGTGWYNSQPNGLVYAGQFAYKYKGAMPANTAIIIKDNSKGIVGEAFDGCSNMTSIVIPNTVSYIGAAAFRNCSGLTSVKLPESLKEIYSLTFNGCSSLKYVRIPNGVTSLAGSSFDDCSNLKCLDVPSSVTKIGTAAFTSKSGIERVAIGSGIQKLVQLAVGKRLKALAVLATTPPDFDVDQFPVDYLYVPKGCIAAYKDEWSGGSSNIREIVIGDVNLDGVADKEDVDALTDYIVGKYPEYFFVNLADLNGDNKVDIIDMVKLIDIIKN